MSAHEMLAEMRNILQKYDHYRTPQKEGNSSFCLPFICESKNHKEKLEAFLNERGVETRPLCSGNLLRQPFLKNYSIDIEWLPNVEYLHNNGFFIGNNHMITDEEIFKLEEFINEFSRIL